MGLQETASDKNALCEQLEDTVRSVGAQYRGLWEGRRQPAKVSICDFTLWPPLPTPGPSPTVDVGYLARSPDSPGSTWSRPTREVHAEGWTLGPTSNGGT